MADQGVKLFLSCVSDEFGEYRNALRRALTRPNVEVKIQEDFKALGGDTTRTLDLGSSPNPESRHLLDPRVSRPRPYARLAH